MASENSIVALHSYFARSSSPPHFIIGPAESDEIIPALKLAAHWNVPILAPATGTKIYNNKDYQTHLTSILPPNRAVALFFKHLFIAATNYHNTLRHVFIVIDNNAPKMIQEMGLDVYNDLESIGLTGKPPSMFSVLVKEDGASICVRNIIGRSQKHHLPPIVIIFSEPKFVNDFITYADKSGYLRSPDENVIFYIDVLEKVTSLIASHHPPHIKQQYESVLQVLSLSNFGPSNNPDFDSFFGKNQSRYLQSYGNAFMMVLSLLDALLRKKNLDDVNNGKELTSLLRDYRYKSIASDAENYISKSGYHYGNFKLYAKHRTQKNYSILATYDGKQNVYQKSLVFTDFGLPLLDVNLLNKTGLKSRGNDFYQKNDGVYEQVLEFVEDMPAKTTEMSKNNQFFFLNFGSRFFDRFYAHDFYGSGVSGIVHDFLGDICIQQKQKTVET